MRCWGVIIVRYPITNTINSNTVSVKIQDTKCYLNLQNCNFFVHIFQLYFCFQNSLTHYTGSYILVRRVDYTIAYIIYCEP